MVVTEQKNTWVKSCKESAQRETERFKMAESLADDAKVEDVDRGRLRKTSKQLREQKIKKKKLVHLWKQCTKTWMKPTPEPQTPSKGCIGSSRSTCTYGDEDLEDHRTSVTNFGK